MCYVDYLFYQEEYHGDEVTEARFPYFEQKASAYVDDITFCRIRDHPDQLTRDVKMAVCAVLEELHRQECIGKEGRISSFSNDGYTEHLSYGNDNRSNPRKLKETAMIYLFGTGLLYRGVSVCD